jgi:hypothetical protein
MNNPTSVLGQARQRIGAAREGVATAHGGMVTTARRCVCVLVLVLLFLTVGVGVPSRETTTHESTTLKHILLDHELMLYTAGSPAMADTLAGTDQQPIEDEGVFSTRARFKSH